MDDIDIYCQCFIVIVDQLIINLFFGVGNSIFCFVIDVVQLVVFIYIVGILGWYVGGGNQSVELQLYIYVNLFVLVGQVDVLIVWCCVVCIGNDVSCGGVCIDIYYCV